MGSRHLCAKATASTCPGASLGGVFRNRASQWMTIGLPTCLAGRSTFGGRALEAADIDAVPVVAIEREASDGQRLAMRTSHFHPIVASA